MDSGRLSLFFYLFFSRDKIFMDKSTGTKKDRTKEKKNRGQKKQQGGQKKHKKGQKTSPKGLYTPRPSSMGYGGAKQKYYIPPSLVVSGRAAIRIIPLSQFSGPKERTKKNQVYNTWGFLHRKSLCTPSPSHIDFGPHRKNLIVLFFEKCKRTKITQTSLTFCPF